MEKAALTAAQNKALSFVRADSGQVDIPVMSASMRDKTSSLILRKIYGAIREIYGMSIFKYMAVKGLHELYEHEFKLQLRNLDQADKKKDLMQEIVDTYLLFEARFFNEELWQFISNLYIEYGDAQAPFIIRIRNGIRSVFLLSVKGDLPTPELEHELLLLEQSIELYAMPAAGILLCRAKAQYFGLVGDARQQAAWWTKALELCELFPDMYPEANLVIRGSLSESLLAMGDRSGADKQCRIMYQLQPGIFAVNGYLNFLFVRILLLGHDKADLHLVFTILQQRYGTLDIAGRPDLRPMDILDFAYAYTMDGQYEIAWKFVQQGMQMNLKVYTGGLMELRLLEAALVFLKNQPDFADNLIMRARKLISTKKDINDAKLWMLAFGILDLINNKGAAKKHLIIKKINMLPANTLMVFRPVLEYCCKVAGISINS
jgi:tetratricopeptide (TPR) repeat protein